MTRNEWRCTIAAVAAVVAALLATAWQLIVGVVSLIVHVWWVIALAVAAVLVFTGCAVARGAAGETVRRLHRRRRCPDRGGVAVSEPSGIDHAAVIDGVELRLKEIAAVHLVKPIMLRDLKISQVEDEITGALATRLAAAVLAKDEREVRRTICWEVRERPWWLPRWLWRRVPTRIAQHTVVVRPFWTFPHWDLPTGPAYQRADVLARGEGWQVWNDR